MRRPSFIKANGPYKVYSRADGTLIVEPEWPDSPPWTDGGGPGLLSRMGLANDLQAWLNAPYKTEPS